MSHNQTISVNNLPPKIHWKGLPYIFQLYVKVIDAFIPQNRAKSGRRFGFIRYESLRDVTRAIERLNGFRLYGHRIAIIKDAGTNILEEGGNDASLKAQFQTHKCEGFTLPQGPATMSKAKQIKSGLGQRQDSRMNLFEEKEKDTCTDG
ncbi:hypothetical protein Gotur_001703 [Gossypium turneri]